MVTVKMTGFFGCDVVQFGADTNVSEDPVASIFKVVHPQSFNDMLISFLKIRIISTPNHFTISSNLSTLKIEVVGSCETFVPT
jgi:hypothetical protein